VADDQLVVTVGEGQRQLYRVTVPDGRVELLAGLDGLDAGVPGISPDRDAVYFPVLDADQNAQLMRVDSDGVTPAFGEGESLTCQARPAWSADEQEVVIACDDEEAAGGKSVFQVPIDGDGATFDAAGADRVVGLPDDFGAVSSAGDGGIVVAHADGIWVHDPDGVEEPRRLTDQDDLNPVTRRGSGDVVFEREGDLFAVSVTGDLTTCPGGPEPGGVTGVAVCRLTRTEQRESNPSWSPDGTRLAYLSRASEVSAPALHVREVSADPTVPGRPIALPGRPGPLCWSSR
jgi:dipeptidyl aminopeptidase/acylaminoacyl peptidase